MRLFLFIILSTGPVLAQAPSQAEQQFFSNQAAVESGGLANTLLMMSVGSMGTAMGSTCLTQSGAALPRSVNAFASASAVYVLAETTAAAEHKRNLEARLAEVRTQAEISKVKGGGDTQRKIIVEAIIEQRAMLDYIAMKVGWLEAAAIQYNNSAAEASNEALDGTNADYNVTCSGTFPASIPVSQSLSEAYKVFGSENRISQYLPSVLPIAVGDLLPYTTLPDQRVILANLAIKTAGNVVTELRAAAVNISDNIANTEKVLTQFDIEEGIAITDGLKPGEKAEKPTSTTGTDFVATSTTTNAGGGTFTPVIQSGNAAAKIPFPQGACWSKPDMTKRTKEEICKDPVIFDDKLVQTTNATVKNSSDQTMSLANALVAKNIAAANLAAGKIANLAANVTANKESAVKALNAKKLKQGKQMLDLDNDTKKALSKVTQTIRLEVIKSGGEKFLASATPVSAPTTQAAIVSAESLSAPQEDKPRFTTRMSAPRFDESSSENLPTAEAKPTNVVKGVSSDMQTTLWDQVSNRYKASYGRLLKKKIPSEENSAP